MSFWLKDKVASRDRCSANARAKTPQSYPLLWMGTSSGYLHAQRMSEGEGVGEMDGSRCFSRSRRWHSHPINSQDELRATQKCTIGFFLQCMRFCLPNLQSGLVCMEFLTKSWLWHWEIRTLVSPACMEYFNLAST